MNDSVNKLLKDMRRWMIDRDLDRTEQGEKLFVRIENALKPPSKTCPTCDGKGYYQEGGTLSQFIDCDCEGFK